MSHNHDDMADPSDDGCSMKMIFHGGACEYILFEGWVANTTGKFVGAVIAVFLFSILYEGLKYLREKWFHEYQLKMNINVNEQRKSSIPISQQIFNRYHIAQTLMHFIQAMVSYALMLIVMTYNVWLFFAVVAGVTLGYFSFGWLRNKTTLDVTDQCH